MIPGLIGLEAGQSAFGDVYAWLRDVLSWSLRLPKQLSAEDRDQAIERILGELTKEAEKLPVRETDLIASDWLNGRRSPYADQTLKGGIVGITLGTTPAQLFKSLVEATAFGSKAIMEHLETEGVQVNEVIGVGGISLKSPYVMQTLSDIMGSHQGGRHRTGRCVGSRPGSRCLGRCIPSMQEAWRRWGKGTIKYIPLDQKTEVYDVLYEKYKHFNRLLEEY